MATSDIAGLAVFTTDSPVAAMGKFRADVLARPLPTPVTPLVPNEIFPDYCVYSSTIDLPDYQQGDPPYSKVGGRWELDPAGKPVAPHNERAHLVVTIPRTKMPAAGYKWCFRPPLRSTSIAVSSPASPLARPRWFRRTVPPTTRARSAPGSGRPFGGSATLLRTAWPS